MRVSTKTMTDTNVWCIEEYPAAAEYSGKFEVQRIECDRKWGIWYCQVCSPASKLVCPHLDSWANKRWEYDEEKLRKHQVMCRICVKCNSNAFANLGRLKTHTNTFEWRMDNNPTAETRWSWQCNATVTGVSMHLGQKMGPKLTTNINKPRIWRRLEPSFSETMTSRRTPDECHCTRDSAFEESGRKGSESARSQERHLNNSKQINQHQNKRVSSWNMATWRAAWEIPEL